MTLEAVRWFRRAAQQEHAVAQTALGVMYANGRGVPFRFQLQRGATDELLQPQSVFRRGRNIALTTLVWQMLHQRVPGTTST